MITRNRICAGLLLATVAVAGCGSDDDNDGSPAPQKSWLGGGTTDNTIVFMSDNSGATWTVDSPTGFGGQVYGSAQDAGTSVVVGTDGQDLIVSVRAVGSGGWTENDEGLPALNGATLNAVTIVDDTWLAVGYDSSEEAPIVLTATDPSSTWSSVTLPVAVRGSLNDVAYDPTNGVVVAVGGAQCNCPRGGFPGVTDATAFVLVSTDKGSQWTQVDIGTGGDTLNGVAFDSQAQQWLAVGSNANGEALSATSDSAMADSWSVSDAPGAGLPIPLYDVAVDSSGNAVAVGVSSMSEGIFFTRTSGTWSGGVRPGGALGFYAVATDGEFWLAGGVIDDNGTPIAMIWRSTDRTTWETQDLTAAFDEATVFTTSIAETD